MNNTIHNVPRELLERVTKYCVSAPDAIKARNEVRALLSAPSPAGVDGLELDRNEAYQACPDSGCDWGSFWQGWKARHAGAQTIIDRLRGEVEVMTQHANNYSLMFEECAEERDQQAQRIGELEGLLREAYKYPLNHACETVDFTAQDLCERIDAALAAGKEGE